MHWEPYFLIKLILLELIEEANQSMSEKQSVTVEYTRREEITR